jgi:hypothetical protein
MTKAVGYYTKIFQTSLHYSHSIGETILEIWIPELKICFNELGGVFSSEEPREKNSTPVQVDDTTVNMLMTKISLDETVRSNLKTIFEQIKA